MADAKHEYPVRDRYLEAQEDRLGRNYEDLAEGLKRLGERIRLEGGEPLSHIAIEQFNAHTYQASGVIHTLVWGIANLNIERILNAARDADHAARLAVEEARSQEETYVWVLSREYDDGNLAVLGVHASVEGAMAISGGGVWADVDGDGNHRSWEDRESGETYVIERIPVRS